MGDTERDVLRLRESPSETLRVDDSRAEVNDAAFRTRTRRWLAHTSEFVAPLLRTGATLATRGRATDPTEWRNGLIIGHNHIGDVLYRTCSLAQLADALPQCKWSYLTSPHSAELLAGNPAIASVLPWSGGENSWELMNDKFGELRRMQFDVVLCTNTLRHYPDLALGVALGIPNRVAFASKGLSGLITRRAPFEFPSVYPAYFRTMVAEVGGGPPDWPLRPRVFPGEGDKEASAREWTRLGFSETVPVVACSITTRQASGNWPSENLLSALEAGRQQMEFDVVLCGSPSDAEELATAATALPFPTRVMAGTLGLRAYVAFLSRCAALLTLDSGPRHLGNAAGIPVLFARNLSHSRVEAGKYCDTEVDLAPAVEYLSRSEAMQVATKIPDKQTAASLLETLKGSSSAYGN